MAAPTALPYGVRDCKLTRYTDASGTVLAGSSVDLPNMQTFSFSESEEFTELRGDDRVVAIRGQGALVDWELEAGGMDFAAWEILTGGTVAESGLTPNRVWTMRKRSTGTRPYFRLEGKAISDSGGDMHCTVYRCRANDTVEGQFADGEFFVTSASGQGLPLLDEVNDLIYEFRLNETVADISTTPTGNPAVQLPPTALATGTIAATTVVLSWTAAANGSPAATDYHVQRRTAFGDWVDATVDTQTTTGARVTGLTTATQYQFRVRAVTTANGNSDWTAPVTATTA
jgi:hypothetical protein